MNWMEKAQADSLESEQRFGQLKNELMKSIREREAIKKTHLESIEIIRDSRNEITELKFNFIEALK